MSQRCRLFLIYAVLLFLAGCGGGGDNAAPPPGTFNFTAISRVMEANPRVVAVAIDFGKALPLNWNLDNAFQVTAELKAVKNYSGDLIANSQSEKAPRTITRAYTSAKAEIGNPSQGQYVIIEMDQADANAASWYFGFNPGTRQAIDYKENMIYEIKLLYELDYFAPNVGTKPPVTVETVKTNSVFKMTATKILTADNFVQGTYTDNTNPNIKTIAYNLYTPTGLTAGQKVPVVLFLHGSGQSHDATNLTDLSADVKSPLLANQAGVTWVENAKEKCFVILPQLPSRASDATGESGWRNSEIRGLVLGLLDKVIADNAAAIDTNRLYLGGLSMGGFGTWKILLDPLLTARFAAAIVDAGVPRMTSTLSTDTAAQKDAKIIADLSTIDYSVVKLPLWMFHCDTDPTVNRLGARYPFTALTGKATLDANYNLVPAAGVLVSDDGLVRYYSSTNNASGSDVRYTEYQYGNGARFLDLGMVTQNGHFSWEPMFKNQAMIDWMFSKIKP